MVFKEGAEGGEDYLKMFHVKHFKIIKERESFLLYT